MERAEDALFRLGYTDFRVRVFTGRRGSSFRPGSWSGPSGSGPPCGRL
ncbi:MAG: hypothetical protein ACLRIS_09130 [Flavonifractor plautii]